MIKSLSVRVNRQGLHSFTEQLSAVIEHAGLEEGLCTLFIQHTSASLLIQENYDPSAQYDLERWLNRLVPENEPLYTYTLEGPDDMPAHIKSILTGHSVSIPIGNGSLLLGTWQGIYLAEFRNISTKRKIIATIYE